MSVSEAYIHLQWIGRERAEEDMLEQVREHLERTFASAVRIGQAGIMPPDAFDSDRGQYSSTMILRWILQDGPADAWKIVMITDCDLFIPVLTFVFGEAQLGGKGAVVSTARLRTDLNGAPIPTHVYLARLLKECVHEVGHTFGLIHCTSSSCAMSRSNTVLDVDKKSARLCWGCHRYLRRLQAKG